MAAFMQMVKHAKDTQGCKRAYTLSLTVVWEAKKGLREDLKKTGIQQNQGNALKVYEIYNIYTVWWLQKHIESFHFDCSVCISKGITWTSLNIDDMYFSHCCYLF